MKAAVFLLKSIAANKIILAAFMVFLLSQHLFAQNGKCPSANRYKTNFIGDGIDTSRLRRPLYFTILADSIIISLDSSGKIIFADFKIEKKECISEINSSRSKSVYTLLVRENGLPPKYPTLTIFEDKLICLRIELLYDTAGNRVFYP